MSGQRLACGAVGRHLRLDLLCDTARQRSAWGDEDGPRVRVVFGLRDEVQRGVDDVNSQVSNVEGVKKFTVLGTDWLPGGDELTPTMKLKRKPVAQKYAEQIEAMYAR